MTIDSLILHDIGQPLIDTWKNTGITSLTECQDEVLAHQPLWEGKNVLVVAPTSSGKTFVGEVLAAKSAFSLKRAIFLVPYKAIAEEKYAEFRERYETLGISVVISDGDHASFDRDIKQGDFGIAVIVYEKMAQLLTQSPGILVNCSLIVVDEIQMISERIRGPLLEILLTHIRQLSEQPQIIGLSATMSDLGGLDSWLNADVINTQGRPVPLWEGFAFPIGSSELENIETKERKRGPDLSSVPSPQSSWRPGSKEDIAYRILSTEGLSKQTLIFRATVDSTVATARELAHVLPANPVEADVRSQIGELENTRASDFLNQWVDKRVAYHNAGLSLEERRLIEKLFREGILKVLVTTSTLTAGVNTPADVVILLDYKRYDNSRRTSMPISVEDYKNSVGRAGRFGISQEGHSYLIIDNSNEMHLLRPHFLLGETQKIRSSIPETGDIGGLALRLLSLGVLTSEDDLKDSIRHSFAFDHYFDNEGDRDHFLAYFVESLGDLEANQLTYVENGRLTVTDLGAVASSSGLSLVSFYELLKLLKNPDTCVNSVSQLFPALCQLAQFQSLRPYDNDKRTEVLTHWIAGNPVSQLIEAYSGQYEIGAGHIRNIGEVAAWVLNTAARAADVLGLVVEDERISKKLSELAQCCRFGVPNSVVPIAELGILNRSELNLLANNSTGRALDTPHKVLDADSSEFVGILSPQRREKLQLAILNQIGESMARRRFGHILRADRHYGLKPSIEKCYDQQGTEFEVALEQLLNTHLLNLRVNRFGQQRRGQPDLEMVGFCGTIVIQATASEDNRKPVSWAKAREVVSSVGYSGQASNFVTVARPGFHDVAIGNSNEIAKRGGQNLLLIALPELIEVLLCEVEGSVCSGGLLRVLEGARGHFMEAEWPHLLHYTQ